MSIEASPLGPIAHTGKGFEIVYFRDHYDADCSLQMSSLADYEQPGTSAVWLGLEESARAGKPRMHLNREQVQALIAHLHNWLENDTFEIAPE